MTGPTSLDIVIVTFNSREEIGACLESIRRSPPPCPWQVIVVDNASTDDTVSVVRERAPWADLVASPENLGFARANNVGIRRGRGDAVLLLNPDTELRPGSLPALCAALASDDAIAVVGPRLVDGRGRVEISWGAMIGPWNELRQKMLGAAYTREVPGVAGWVDRAARRSRRVDWVSGACLLVWRRVAEAVGLLDERFFFYTEDVDFCASIRARGGEVRFAPEAEVVHWRGRSRAARPAEAEAAYRQSQLAFYAKHHPRWAKWLVRYLRLKGVAPDRDGTAVC